MHTGQDIRGKPSEVCFWFPLLLQEGSATFALFVGEEQNLAPRFSLWMLSLVLLWKRTFCCPNNRAGRGFDALLSQGL